MLTNYLTTAWRYLVRDKGVSLISMLSLTLGLPCALLVFVFLQHEWIRDDFHANGDRIFRIYMTDATGENKWELRSAMLSSEVGPEIERSFPEVETTIRFRPTWRRLRMDDFTTRIGTMAFADSTFFDTFTFEILHGNHSPSGPPIKSYSPLRPQSVSPKGISPTSSESASPTSTPPTSCAI